MPSILSVSYNEDTIVFVNNKTNKSETLALHDVMDDSDAIKAVQGEIRTRENVSRASVSLLANILNNPRIDAYKGATAIGTTIPKELKQAIRELETEYLKPVFVSAMVKKGAPDAKKGQAEEKNTSAIAKQEKAWQEFASGLRDGGGYANAKSRVVAYFAHCGKLPVCDNGKLLTVAAIDKLLQNEKAKQPQEPEKGIAGKLVELAMEVKERTEKTEMGHLPSGIAALKSMLATFEGLEREMAEAMTKAKGAGPAAAAAISKAAEIDTEESLTTLWNNGALSDEAFQIRMLAIGLEVILE